MKAQRLQVYLPRDISAILCGIACSERTTASALARRVVVGWLASNAPQARIEAAGGANHSGPMVRSHKVGVRVSEPVFERLESVATTYGQTPAGWAASLLAHVLLDRPLFRHDELTALRESNRQLWSAGVLLNQIARACNLECKARGSADASQLPVELIAECLSAVRHTSDRVTAVLEGSRQVFRRSESKADAPTGGGATCLREVHSRFWVSSLSLISASRAPVVARALAVRTGDDSRAGMLCCDASRATFVATRRSWSRSPRRATACPRPARMPRTSRGMGGSAQRTRTASTCPTGARQSFWVRRETGKE